MKPVKGVSVFVPAQAPIGTCTCAGSNQHSGVICGFKPSQSPLQRMQVDLLALRLQAASLMASGWEDQFERMPTRKDVHRGESERDR